MNFLAIGPAGGAVFYYGNFDLARQNKKDDEFELEVDDLPDDDMTFSVDGTQLIAVIRPLDAAKTGKWNQAKNYRDNYASGGCATPSGLIDTDADSQNKLNGAVTAAMISKQASAPFSVDWTMADNSVVTMNADALIAAGMAVVTFLNACQGAGTAIRQSIDAAADQATLDTIDITAGYPANH